MRLVMQEADQALAQALAADAHNRQHALALESFIVEAPAGAGKTELLTQRVLKLLQTVQAPEEIIAITFTNKAASEMRARILDSLQLAAKGVMPPQPHKQITFTLGQAALQRSAELGWHLLEAPARLRIYTIDSLCANLARQMPLLSRFGTQPAVTEDAWFYYREAASQAIQAMEDDTHGPAIQQVLRYVDNDQIRLESLLQAMLAKREQWLHLSQYGADDENAEISQALTTLVEAELAEVLQVMPARRQQALMPIARYAASQLPAEHPLARLLDWQVPLAANIHDLPAWQALAELLLTGTGGLRKRLDKNMGLAATDEAKPYKEALTEILQALEQEGAESTVARLRKLPAGGQDPEGIIIALTQLLHIAVAQLWLCFQQQHEVDFVEISQRALQALQAHDGSSTELAMRLDYRIQHLLVDEFQDTSPTQIALLRALTQGWQAGDGRTLFAVGDPMQSIYRFRKANVGLFLQVAQHGIGDIALTPLKLWRNNRSCPPVVAWINQTFKGMLPPTDNPQQGAIRYRPFVATRADHAGAGVTVHPLLVPVESDEEADSTDIRHIEAERIIQIIHDTRAAKPEATIAVLVRARRHLHALVGEMRRNHAGLSFQAVEIEELANRQIVQDLLSLTHALHQLADRVHWLALLRAPWCGLTLADLHALIGNDSQRTVLALLQDEQRLTMLSSDGQQRARHLREVMHSALALRGRATLSRWIHNTWLRLGGASCLWDANDVQDVQAFFARIEALSQHDQFSPEALADDVQKLYAAPDANADTRLQFMTIHKSKGLEFDTVILPGLDGGNPPDDPRLVIWEEVPLPDGRMALAAAPWLPTARKRQLAGVSAYDYLNDLDKTRAAYEDARVLYVAATRAERHLHLLGAAKPDKSGAPQPRKGSFLHLLWPSIVSQFTAEHDIVARYPRSTQQSDIASFVPKLIRLQNPAIPARLQVNTAIQSMVNPRQASDADSQSSVLQRALEADIGTLTHMYLQLIAEQGLAHWETHIATQFKALQAAIQRWFRQRGYQEAEQHAASSRVTALLTTTLLSADGLWALQPHVHAASELAIDSLTAPLSQGFASSKKVIDRTFVAEGTRWIIDYKSMPVTTNDDLPAVAARFAPQLAAYATLFAHEHLPIRTAILFLNIGTLVPLDHTQEHL
ncbi:UvrD-helicase domain-containing protein [Methylophilus aquaticus]|uniref:DNA 3'-5' helicase n=1 Tax=Methylophilus aquaticus TaxID=1971610 RepID=A0ABT9JRU8_9PROT|nr:UvrD-helicase domain-containing protein [Methylophilus aquaticus]MDP8567274.1 UvrD-helicase domain-containing protein [Methylophilus aquaticus]